TVGSQTLRHCIAALRATSARRAVWRRALAASQRTTLRSAANGTIRSTPSSVSFWTVNSGRSPLTRANATVRAGTGRGSATTSPTGSTSGPAVSRAGRQRPHPSPTVTALPAGRRSTRARWWWSPSDRRGAARSGTKACARAVSGVVPPSPGRATALLERGAQFGDQPVGRRRHRLAPQLGEVPDDLLLFLRQLGGHVDHDVEEQVAPAAAVEVRDAAAADPERGARGRAPGDLDRLDAVERLEL